MEFINAIIPETYRTAIGWTILHSIWQIISISVILYICLRICEKKSASFKYTLSFASLLIIMAVSAITFVICLSNTNATTDESLIPIFTSSQINSSVDIEITYSTYLYSKIEKYIPLLVNIWFVGAVLFLFRLGGNFSAIKNLRKSAKIDIPKKWIEFAYEQKIKLGITRTLSLLTSNAIQCPITFGSLKPIILIPTSLLFHLTPEQLEAIITHELAHIKRNDYLHNIIQSTMEAIFFYHPCFWWINGYVREQRENACDDLAIQAGISPKTLAYGLAEVFNHAHEPYPEMALAAGTKNHPTLHRIKRMLGLENQKTKFPSLISYTMIFTMLISASLVLGANHVNSVDKDRYLSTEAHFTQNIPWDLPATLAMDTIPQKKIVYIIKEDENSEEISPDSVRTFKNRMIIINGDTQRMSIPTKPMIAFLNDSIMAHMPRFKMDSAFMDKFRIFKFDSAMQKSFHTYKMDTSIFDKETIKKLERNAKAMELHGKELEKHIQVWTMKNQPKMDELQQRIKEKEVLLHETHEKFSKDIEPHLKELEKKMEEWQKEFAPKMEEFQRKMEIWQQENSKQLEEIHKAIQENVKKGDN